MSRTARTSPRTRLAVAAAGVALSTFAVAAPTAYASLDDGPKAEGEAYVETGCSSARNGPTGARM